MNKLSIDKLYKRNSLLFFLVFVAMLSSLLVFIKLSKTDDIMFVPEAQPLLESDWTFDGKPISLPQEISLGDKATGILSCTLPDDLQGYEAIYYNASYCGQQVFVDDEMIYSFAAKPQLPFGDNVGSTYVLVSLPKDAAGKTLTIKMRNPYAAQSYVFEGVSIGDPGEFKFIQLREHLWRYALFFTSALVSAFLIIFALYMIYHHADIKCMSFIYLALMVFSVGLWVLCDPCIMQYFSNDTTIVQYISILSLFNIGASYMGLCACYFTNHQLVFRVLEHIGYTIILVMIITYVLDISNPVDFLTMVYVYGSAYLLISLIVILRHHKEYSFSNIIVMGTFILIVGTSFTIYRFIKNPSGTDAVRGILISFEIYIFCLFFVMVKEAIRIIQSSSESQMYQKLAYTDELTQIPNRAAFENALEECRDTKNQDGLVSLFICDLNYLKQANDKQGHAAGDQLIISAAQCLSNTFSSNGQCFRIGGDEFAVLIKNSSPEKIDRLLEKLYREMDAFNANSELYLSMAIGIATRSLPINNDIDVDILREADTNMYTNKIKMHAERSN